MGTDHSPSNHQLPVAPQLGVMPQILAIPFWSLYLAWSCVANHSSHEFMCTTAVSCLEDTVHSTPRHSMVLAISVMFPGLENDCDNRWLICVEQTVTCSHWTHFLILPFSALKSTISRRSLPPSVGQGHLFRNQNLELTKLPSVFVVFELWLLTL